MSEVSAFYHRLAAEGAPPFEDLSKHAQNKWAEARGYFDTVEKKLGGEEVQPAELFYFDLKTFDTTMMRILPGHLVYGRYNDDIDPKWYVFAFDISQHDWYYFSVNDMLGVDE